MTGDSPKEFEDEVRRIARLLWPSAEHDGAAMRDGRERDGVFETEDFIHIVEATVARTKSKATEDFDKIQKLIRQTEVRRPQKFVKGWFITAEEPTADQRTVFENTRGRIVALSFDQLRSKLVDARSYLDLRREYPFGSMRDPETDDFRTKLDYVPLDILDASGGLHTVDTLSHDLSDGSKHSVLSNCA